MLSLSAIALALAVSLGTPASAGRVQDAVASLTEALGDIGTAGGYFGSESTPSILSGLSDYAGSLAFNRNVARRVLDAYIDGTTLRDRRALYQDIRRNVRDTTDGLGQEEVLRDVFYIDFVGAIRRVTSGGPELREQLALLFGESRADKLLQRYRDAVSRTK